MQEESEDIDEAWERLNNLLTQGPNLEVTSDESLQIFYFRLTSEAFRYVNMCAGGSLMSKSTSEANEILSNICLTSKEERERREREDEEAEADMDKVVPTPEAQLPTLHTLVSFGFDDKEYERLHWIPANFGEPLKCEGLLPLEYLEEEEEFFH